MPNTDSKPNQQTTRRPNKKNPRRKSKKKQAKGISENFLALIFIFAGIFLSLSLRTSSMGIIGRGVKYVFLGFFSKLSIILSFLLIFAGVYKLIYGDRFTYKEMKKLPFVLASFLGIVVYGLFNREFFPKSNPLSLETTRLIFREANRGEGIGMIPGTLIFFLNKLLGFYGCVILAIALALFILIRYFKMDIQKVAAGLFRVPSQTAASSRSLFQKMKDFVMVDVEESDESVDQHHIVSESEEGRFLAEKPAPPEEVAFVEGENNQIELTVQRYNRQRREGMGDYVFPETLMLKTYEKISRGDITPKSKSAKLLESTLLNFGVDARVKQVSQGPTITRYELEPKAGTKVSKITNLTEDLALALAARTIRIEAPIPGKSLIGIEVPNERAEMVNFKEIMESAEFLRADAHIAFGLGKDIAGETIVADIAKMPHMLVAGATGSGKSVCINTLICSLLYKYTPKELKMIMIDPKMVELSIYNGIPHLLVPVVTDMKKAPSALNWAVAEMNRRYKLFAENRVKDIGGYNGKSEEKLPRIVIIVDELADLMMVSPNEVEDAICRLAQMARACGMHLVIATQRPSVDVITGLIKANIPSRIAFAVSSQTDSRTILDTGGADKLLGRGDMLYYPMGSSKPLRVQGAFITEEEVTRVTDFIREHNAQEEDTTVAEELEVIQEEADSDEDPLMEEVVEFIVEREQASTSMIQRRFKMGYNRAARIMDDLERRGIIGPAEGSKPRRVYMEKGND